MAKALIDPRSNRVCEVRATEFDVAPPLKWVDIPQGKDVRPDEWTHDGKNFVAPAFVQPTPKPSAVDVATAAADEVFNKALIDVLATKLGMTAADLTDAIKSSASKV